MYSCDDENPVKILKIKGNKFIAIQRRFFFVRTRFIYLIKDTRCWLVSLDIHFLGIPHYHFNIARYFRIHALTAWSFTNFTSIRRKWIVRSHCNREYSKLDGDATRSLRFSNGDGVRQLCIFLIAGLHARVHQTIKNIVLPSYRCFCNRPLPVTVFH